MTAKRVHQVLAEWFAKKQITTVTFQAKNDPINDPKDSYVVVYEAAFEPNTLDQARVELWLTDDGRVSIGFETHVRIAAHFDAKTRSKRFVSGHEPCQLTEQALLAILDAIANGEIALSVRKIPWVGLLWFLFVGTPKAVASVKTVDTLVSKGYWPVTWIRRVEAIKFNESGHLLHFRAWKN